LSTDGVAENVQEDSTNRVSQILLRYTIIALFLLYYGYDKYLEERYVIAGSCVLIALLLIVGLLTSRNNSSRNIIKRSEIKEVKFVKGLAGLSRSRFEIYIDDTGKRKRRLVLLPGSMSGGKEETKKALEIMKKEDLYRS